MKSTNASFRTMTAEIKANIVATTMRGDRSFEVDKGSQSTLASLEVFQHWPVRDAPFYGRVKVVPAASTTRKHSASPSVADKSAASALHPAL